MVKGGVALKRCNLSEGVKGVRKGIMLGSGDRHSMQRQPVRDRSFRQSSCCLGEVNEGGNWW